MDFPDKAGLSAIVKEAAISEGFLECGISQAVFLEKEKEKLTQWLRKGYHGEMSYMQRNTEKRLDPRLLVENARSVISVIMSYYPEKHPNTEGNYKIAKYALGRDYHKVIRKKLKKIVDILKEQAGSKNTRAFTDSAPVLDRVWAERAGLGWTGKNTCLINPKYGSFFFIGEVITDVELVYDETRIKDFCGGCTKCLDACPTGALIGPGVLDSTKCISYFTIEYKKEFPKEFHGKFNDWIFGCDICQDVCPWNRIAKSHKVEEFRPSSLLLEMHKEKWHSLTEGQFNEMFAGSAVKRTGFEGLRRNIRFIKSTGRNS
jgi:epoxyqueuosine reductase